MIVELLRLQKEMHESEEKEKKKERKSWVDEQDQKKKVNEA